MSSEIFKLIAFESKLMIFKITNFRKEMIQKIIIDITSKFIKLHVKQNLLCT